MFRSARSISASSAPSVQRIASHMMATGFLLNDLGAFATPLMYCFRERERILDLFEMLCGARITPQLHASGRRVPRRA